MIGSSATAQIPCHYEVTAIIEGPYCGEFGSPTTPIGISPNGRFVCGLYATCGLGATRAWVYDLEAAQMITLPFPAGISAAYANDVNDAGLVVGGMGGSGGDFGFIYDLNTGQYVLQIPPAVANGNCFINAINSTGKVCGQRSIGVSPPLKSAFTWSASEGVIDLGLINGKNTNAVDLNDAGTVTGTLFVGVTQHVMLWKNGVATDLGSPTEFDSRAGGINAREQIGGGWDVQPSPVLCRPGIWTISSLTELPMPIDSISAGVVDINASAVCVGRARYSNNTAFAVAWFDDQYAILDDLTQRDGLDSLVIAKGISNTGRMIVESHLLSNFNPVAVVLTPKPLIAADIDINCHVNIDDLLIVINEWGKRKSEADINQDGIVNSDDLIEVVDNWTC